MTLKLSTDISAGGHFCVLGAKKKKKKKRNYVSKRFWTSLQRLFCRKNVMSTFCATGDLMLIQQEYYAECLKMS